MKWVMSTSPPKDADYTKITLKDHISEIIVMAEKDGYLMLRRKGKIPFVLSKSSLFLTGITHWRFTNL